MMTWLDGLAARPACGGLGEEAIAALIIIPDLLASERVSA